MLVFEAEVLKVFALALVRVSGLFVSAPVLGSQNFPLIGKIGLTALTAMLITPGIAALNQPLPSDVLPFAWMAVGELMIGIMMGFVMTLVFSAIQIGGQIMDMQSGFGMMNIFNPSMETQFPIFGFILYIVAVLLLLATNGHHLMIRALVSTFETIPLGGFVLRPALVWEVSQWGRAMFYDGIMISAPIGAAMLVAYVAMGLMGRLVPQIQMFVMGFPLTIALGLFIVAISMDLYLRMLEGLFGEMFRNVSRMADGMK